MAAAKACGIGRISAGVCGVDCAAGFGGAPALFGSLSEAMWPVKRRGFGVAGSSVLGELSTVLTRRDGRMYNKNRKPMNPTGCGNHQCPLRSGCERAVLANFGRISMFVPSRMPNGSISCAMRIEKVAHG